MSAAAVHLVEYDPLRDKTYQSTRLGRDVVDFLAWLELGGTAPRTLDQYERDLARGAKLYPSKGIADLTDGDAFQIAKLYTPGERRTRVAAWRSFYKWGRQTRRVTVNPFDALPTIKTTPKQLYDIFTAEEIAALCNLPIRDGALFQVMFDTGARKGDCTQIRLRNWRSEATPDAPYGAIIFQAGKGGKNRQVPATQAVAQKISELAILDGLDPADHLWYTRPGGRPRPVRLKSIGDGSFDRWYYRCLEEAGVRATSSMSRTGQRNPHLTRHTFATRYLRARGRLETLSRVMGHASIKTTFDEYGHVDMSDVAMDMGLVAVVEAVR